METGSNGAHDPVPDDERRPGRLDSWKEIAAYFGRDERTLRRWEKDEALPVHRHVHQLRASVYAFRDELDRWQAQRVPSTFVEPVVPVAPRRRFAPVATLAAVVLASLGVTLWVSAGRRATEPGESNAEEAALSHWLKDPKTRRNFLLARHHLSRATGFRTETREYLEEAVREAPDFPEAHALLAEIYYREAVRNPDVRATAWVRSEAAVRRALELDDHLAIAHATRSLIAMYRDWDWTTAAAECRRAIELAPDSWRVRSVHATYLRAMGRSAEAILERERARQALPLNPQLLVNLGDEYLFARRNEDAIDAYTQALELERNYLPAVTSLADGYARLGRFDNAADWQARVFGLRADAPTAAAFDEVRRRDGSKAALAWLDRHTVEEYQLEPDRHVWDLAWLHARLGHPDEAIAFLQRAVDRHEAGLLQARVDPDLDSLRTDPRFIHLLARVGPG